MIETGGSGQERQYSAKDSRNALRNATPHAHCLSVWTIDRSVQCGRWINPLSEGDTRVSFGRDSFETSSFYYSQDDFGFGRPCIKYRALDFASERRNGREGQLPYSASRSGRFGGMRLERAQSQRGQSFWRELGGCQSARRRTCSRQLDQSQFDWREFRPRGSVEDSLARCQPFRRVVRFGHREALPSSRLETS